mgnify:CR=1 FL=1
MPPPLLLTRPEADARRFARLLPGWPAVIAPILRIEPVAHDGAALASAPGLVFTSAHAVPAAGPGRGRPAICVGAGTGAAARAAGFAVTEGEGTATSLLPLIAACPTPLIHPHGRHLARALPVPGVVVYDQVPQPLTAEAAALLAGEGPVILPVFSPRSARLLAEAVGHVRAPLWLVAISPAADAAFTAPAARRVLADAPSAEAMAAAISRIAAAERS